MHVEMDVALDPTLGCGQAHRWKKQEDGIFYIIKSGFI